MSENQVVMKLKDPILDQMGEKIHEVSRLEVTADQTEGKTPHDLKMLAPILDVGTLVLRILATGIKTKNVEESGKVFVYITSLRNKYQTTKAEWHLDEKDLGELESYIDKTEGLLNSPMLAGQIRQLIDNLKVELMSKTKKKDTTSAE